MGYLCSLRRRRRAHLPRAARRTRAADSALCASVRLAAGRGARAPHAALFISIVAAVIVGAPRAGHGCVARVLADGAADDRERLRRRAQ